MTPQQLTHAAAWLRRAAEQAGRKHAEYLQDRRHRPRRVVSLPRDCAGRWTAPNRRAA